ncbi:uncharacterized protein PHACADRAFT_251546 [Phanerochaete carnosa HHB-10118-sp]|uniref:Peptidase C14 caspase domain-containing protein n=1 Tax=Phanerochaete carnosa (strain HHB-10118-sp) TaxID=650164 RepID=K5WEL5_PHACS|nr:uncharacterized protein PHACADRAFT_251546 [Phanerochaete carnosa HHB-10118-sp]EKM57730.1 hypothetical protein PHACADRAFT_251546 [Phanerochaete carnosa HHB-10118-sp]
MQYDAPERPPVGRLRTPHRDVRLLKDFLIRHEGYLEQNIVVLIDDPANECMRPTKANIEAAIEAFMKDIQPGDRRVFFVAGHGYQIISRTGTEDDNMDEVILLDDHLGEPLDVEGKPLDPYQLKEGHPDRGKLEGIITDNFLRERLVDRLPPGARLVAIFDTCHSGTMLDLDYHWDWRHLRYTSRRSSSGYVINPRHTVYSATHTRSFVYSATQRTGARASISKTSMTLTDCAVSSSAAWVPDDTTEERPQCSSPTSERAPVLPQPSKGPPYGPVAADVLSISSAKDSQRAWGGEHTMLTVLLDILRESKEGQRPKVCKFMGNLQ